MGLTPSLRLELLEILAPKVRMRKPFVGLPASEGDGKTEKLRVRDFVEWEIALGDQDDYIRYGLDELAKDEKWTTTQPDLMFDFTNLLRDTLDLMSELGGADILHDGSYWQHPSISAHGQNKRHHVWPVLIDLCRDAWLGTVARDTDLARLEVKRWLSIKYPLFRRLAFFAATRPDVFTSQEAAVILQSEDAWWLWSVETKREAVRLLVSLAARFEPSVMNAVQQAICDGPPKELFRDGIAPEEYQQFAGREVWLRLAKIQNAGGLLNQTASDLLRQLSEKHPMWELAPDERDEFAMWMDVGWDFREKLETPSKYRELVQWLRENPKGDTWKQDYWRDRCQKDFGIAAAALASVSRTGNWEALPRWQEALQVWSEGPNVIRSWRFLAKFLDRAPDKVLLGLGPSFSRWLQSVGGLLEGGSTTFFNLVRRVLEGNRPDEVDFGDDPVFRALNHPIGQATEAVFHWWYRQDLRDGQGLSPDVASILTELSDTSVASFRLGRIFLATNVISLFRVDQDWTVKHVVPLFDWNGSVDEALAAWKGFLWTPRLYAPLLRIFKPDFLQTAHHYMELGEVGKQYASILVLSGLEPADVLNPGELRTATQLLPPQGLQAGAEMLVRAQEGSGDRKSEYWRNRVRPYLDSVWPKTETSRTPEVSKEFARLCIATDDAFPEAVQRLRPWLRPFQDFGYLVNMLAQTDSCRRFPAQALDWLAAVVDTNWQWTPRELRNCLDEIQTTDPALANSADFRRLNTYFLQSGRG